jgi:ribose transport system ATP-binding protein
VGTVDAAATPVAEVIAMMVGRRLTDEAVAVPDLAGAPVALEVRGITRGREVRDVSFSMRRGEILGFAGLMGAGRTELARAIFGADPRDAGEILVHGKRVEIRSPADAVAAGIGYLSEDRKHFGLATGMDVRANIVMASLARFASRVGLIDERGAGVAARETSRGSASARPRTGRRCACSRGATSRRS